MVDHLVLVEKGEEAKGDHARDFLSRRDGATDVVAEALVTFLLRKVERITISKY